ncbi:hypothetical protein J6590_064150 [Homalodisca vitripennis]|nr:hypothetical protein J6590_064150 [Homalodisca vitripennis]
MQLSPEQNVAVEGEGLREEKEVEHWTFTCSTSMAVFILLSFAFEALLLRIVNSPQFRSADVTGATPKHVHYCLIPELGPDDVTVTDARRYVHRNYRNLAQELFIFLQ